MAYHKLKERDQELISLEKRRNKS